MAFLLYVCPSILLQSSKSWNALSNLEQGNGFSPVWILSCYFKVPHWLKTLSHLVHANGLSHVWVLSCFFEALLSLNALSHLEQGNGLLDPNFYKTFTSIESLPCFRVNSSLLILGPFPAFTPKLHCHWMPCHTWNREMASLLCEFCHASSNCHFGWKPCHT